MLPQNNSVTTKTAGTFINAHYENIYSLLNVHTFSGLDIILHEKQDYRKPQFITNFHHFSALAL